MFGDAMYEEEERIRRAQRQEADPTDESESSEFVAAGGLEEQLRRREAIVQLLREVGGC